MAHRPYFKYSAVELATLFKENKNNRPKLKMLEYELSHRRTPSARRLADEVTKHLIKFDQGITIEKSMVVTLEDKSVTMISPQTNKVPSSRPSSISPEKPTVHQATIIIECSFCQQANVTIPKLGISAHQCIACAQPFSVEYKNGLVRATFTKNEPKSKPTKNPQTLHVAFIIVVLFVIYLLWK